MSAPAAERIATLRGSHAAGTAFLGMVIFIASWAMLFAGLFFAYGLVRSKAAVWPPMDLPALPLALPALATLFLAGASGALHRATAVARAGVATAEVGRWLGLAIGAGIVFLALQMIVWRGLWLSGLQPNTGTYASAFYMLTVFHGLHVVVGLIGLLWLTLSGLLGRGPDAVPVRLWTLYWHMVGAIWAVMFLLVYVL